MGTALSVSTLGKDGARYLTTVGTGLPAQPHLPASEHSWDSLLVPLPAAWTGEGLCFPPSFAPSSTLQSLQHTFGIKEI